jgi:hypothetical protein
MLAGLRVWIHLSKRHLRWHVRGLAMRQRRVRHGEHLRAVLNQRTMWRRNPSVLSQPLRSLRRWTVRYMCRWKLLRRGNEHLYTRLQSRCSVRQQ